MHPPFDESAWTALVDELDASARADRDDLVRELTAAHAAELLLSERLAPAVGGPVRVRLAPCPEIEGTLMRVGRDHLWVADGHGYWLLVIAEVDGVARPPTTGGTAEIERWRPVASAIDARGLASAIGELVGVGTSVSLLVGNRWAEGRLSLVGADFVEVDGLVVPLGRVRACRVWY